MYEYAWIGIRLNIMFATPKMVGISCATTIRDRHCTMTGEWYDNISAKTQL